MQFIGHMIEDVVELVLDEDDLDVVEEGRPLSLNDEIKDLPVQVNFYRRPENDDQGLKAVYDNHRSRLDVSVNRHEGDHEIMIYDGRKVPVQGENDMGLRRLQFRINEA